MNFLRALVLGLMLWAGVSEAESQNVKNLDMQHFAEWSILHEGRLKPLDTYARVTQQTLRGTSDKNAAIDWLARLIFKPEVALQEPMVYVPNLDVQAILKLPKVKGHKYSFVQLRPALRENRDLINTLLDMPDEELDVAQRTLMETHLKVLWLFDLSRSMTLIQPIFQLPDSTLAQRLGVPDDRFFSYLNIAGKHTQLLDLLAGVESKSPEQLTPQDVMLLDVAMKLRAIDETATSKALPIVPPQWQGDFVGGAVWRSPWDTLQNGQGSPQTAEFFEHLTKAAEAYRQQDNAAWLAETKAVFELVASPPHVMHPALLKWEVWYNKLDLFAFSLWVYGVSVLLAIGFSLLGAYWLRHWATGVLIGAFAVHVVGIVLRMMILQRPPVATLYESILFVGAVTVLLGLILEQRRRDGVGTLLAAASGAFLQLVGLRYAADGDSMGMLVAVLNTNFWLATHVVTITIGYGCSLITALVAHVYLVRRALGRSHGDLKDLMKNIMGLSFIALFFTALGTILGGIWADQSWGRFWGWDPKENGALLIVLWLAWVLHGRLSGILKPVGVAVGFAFTSVIVVLAWFGVNLLNVGLHSYGFTQNIAWNIMLFCGAEVLIIFGLLGVIRFKYLK